MPRSDTFWLTCCGVLVVVASIGSAVPPFMALAGETPVASDEASGGYIERVDLLAETYWVPQMPVEVAATPSEPAIDPGSEPEYGFQPDDLQGQESEPQVVMPPSPPMVFGP
jgi:hypothetical protein